MQPPDPHPRRTTETGVVRAAERNVQGNPGSPPYRTGRTGGPAGRWQQTTTAPKTETAPPKCVRGTSGHPPLNGGFFAPSYEALEEIGRRGSNARGRPRVNNNNGNGGE
uniref:Uncharacterized protein n=1 Tax=Ixodes ricinus TaxID=34613 RepID=A0A0K8RLP5_IXORI